MRATKREQATRILMMALGVAAGIAVAGAQEPAAAPAATTADPAPVAVVSAPPEAPVRPPKVVCTGNVMTISASNSTLSSVLDEVHRCMGTRIDIPEAAGEKKLFDKIGPGPASQVLDELLSNTGYNYVIGAAPGDDEKIESIVLLARTGNEPNAPAVVDDNRAGSANRRAFMQMHQASIPHPMTDEDNTAAATLAPAEPAQSAATPAPAPADGQPAATTPAADATQKPAEATPTQPDTPATPAAAPNSYSAHPSTTEEQIVNMQQMFELRKQMNQQTNGAPPNSTPPQ